MVKKNFKIYRSSAGSGKTYSLVRNYIRIALTGNENKFDPIHFKFILAITFTNKAASEMKDRVFNYLEDLKNGVGKDRKESFFSHIKKDTNLSSKEIEYRSRKVLDKILHKYSDLSISTIDKFTYRIVKTFAHDLNFEQNFDVEMDSSKLIQPVIALLINKVGEDPDLSKILVDFSFSKLEEGKSYNLEQDLEEFSKHIFNERNQTFIKSLATLNYSDCIEVKNILLKDIKKFEKKIIKKIEIFKKFTEENNLTKSSFYRGYFYNYILNLKNFDLDKFLPNETLKKNIESDIWFSKATSELEKQIIEKNKSFLSKIYTDIQDLLDNNFKSYLFKKLVIKNIYSIAVLNEILNQLKDYKTNNNIRHISEFNYAISNIVRNEYAPFIYERLGEKYKHFLIDEFQDTSIMQWHNLLPLINNSLANGFENLIVGDAKQSIYRWRGGEVDQFTHLPNKIFDGDKLPNHIELKNSIKQNAIEEVLEYNWRSAYSIVDFNNNFFALLKETLPNELKSIYLNHNQKPKRDSEGYVYIDFIHKSDDIKRDIMLKLISQIKLLNKENNYLFSDMVVLCRTRNDASIAAYYLNKHKIKVVSDEAMLINESNEVRLLISLLTILSNPYCKISMSLVLNYVYANNKLTDLNEMLKILNKKSYNTEFKSLLNEKGFLFNPKILIQFSLYDLVENLIKIFNLSSHDIYLQFFLDVIFKYTLKYGNDIEGFIDWWIKNNHKESIVLPDQLNAVKVMTVHKSKGLEFPIVFIPFDWTIGKGDKDLWVNTKGELSKMNIALISNSKKVEKTEYKKERLIEQNKAYLDDLNVLYVALTRASDQMYVFTQSPLNDNKLNTLGKIFNFYLSEKGYKTPYSLGKIPNYNITKNITKNVEVYKLNYKTISDWKSIVEVKNNFKNVWDTYLDQKKWGVLLHEVLSKINYLGDENKILDELISDGLIEDNIKKKLIKKVHSLLSHPSISIFFDPKWTVLTEKEILDPSGESYIPDRVLINNDDVYIIDYKTGSRIKFKEHCKQINQYCLLMKKMGYDNIKKIIIYTEEKNKVVFV